MPTVAPHPSETGLPTSAVLLLTARAALEITAEEMAEAAGCDVSLVEQIESGEHDPVMDTVGRLVSVVGLELRCGAKDAPNPGYLRVDPGEVARVAKEIAKSREFWGQFGCQSPTPSHQTEWDGIPPAPPHLYGAGRGRRHEGGWAALLVGSARFQRGGRGREPGWEREPEAEFASVVGVSEAALAEIESGEVRPPMGEVQRILTAAGRALYVHLEVYEDHDDGLHQLAMEDLDRHDRIISHNKKVFSSAVVIS